MWNNKRVENSLLILQQDRNKMRYGGKWKYNENLGKNFDENIPKKIFHVQRRPVNLVTTVMSTTAGTFTFVQYVYASCRGVVALIK